MKDSEKIACPYMAGCMTKYLVFGGSPFFEIADFGHKGAK